MRQSTGAAVIIDVFASALVSCVPEPSDVFEIVALRLARDPAFGVPPLTFSRIRHEAHAAALRESGAVGRDVDPSLEAIYEVVGRRLPDIDPARALREELAVLRALSIANPTVRRRYDALRARGADIVFLSRSPLPAAFVVELLREAGYSADNVVATSERPAGSRSLRARLEAASAARSGRRRRLRTLRAPAYPPRRPSGRRPASIGEKVLARLDALEAANGGGDERSLRLLGSTVVGPMFLGLTQWLAAEVRRQAPDLVVFCARDGFFIRALYDRLAASDALPPSQYLEVSRRALVFPSIEALDARALDVLCANNATIAASEYFSRLGLEPAQYEAELADAGLSPATRIATAQQRQRIRDVLQCLEPAVVAKAREERPYLLEYLRNAGVFDVSTLAFFDIGWGGTLQDALATVLRREGRTPAMAGYYLSTDDRIERLPAQAGTALAWFANAARPVWRQRVIASGYWFLEIAFSAPHGTVLGYRRATSGRVEAVRQSYDPRESTALAGGAIQRAALAFGERWLRIFDGEGPAISLDTSFSRFQRFVDNPRNDEARFFGDLLHVGGLGTTSEETRIAKPPDLVTAVRRPVHLLTAYQQTHWRRGFVQRVLRGSAATRFFFFVRARLGRDG